MLVRVILFGWILHALNAPAWIWVVYGFGISVGFAVGVAGIFRTRHEK